MVSRQLSDVIKKWIIFVSKNNMESRYNLRTWREADCQMIFDWRMSPEVRSKSFNNQKFSYESHKSWFQKFMENKLSFGFILEVDNNPVAQIRFDKTKIEGYYNISIFTAPNNSGKGYGSRILSMACKDENILKTAKYFVAEVFDDNIPSKKIFFKNGFEVTGETDVDGHHVLLFKRQALYQPGL